MTRAVFALMGTVLYAALVITSAGFESLLLDRDVIAERDAGTLLGPSMVAAAVLVVLLSLLRSAALADSVEGRAPEVRGTFPAQPASEVRATPSRPGPRGPGGEAPASRPAPPRLPTTALLTALLVWVVMVATGSVGYGLVRDDLVAVALFAGSHALSPFVLGSAAWAALVVVGTVALSRVQPST